MVGAGVYFQNFVRPEMADKSEKKEANEEVAAPRPIVLEIQMRLLVGLAQAAMADKDEDEAAKNRAKESIATQVQAFNHGSVDQRLRVIIGIGEIAGYDKARAALADLHGISSRSNTSGLNSKRRCRRKQTRGCRRGTPKGSTCSRDSTATTPTPGPKHRR